MAEKKKLPSARSHGDNGMKKMKDETRDDIKKYLGDNKAIIHMENTGTETKGYMGGEPEALFRIFRSIATDPMALDLMVKACAIAMISGVEPCNHKECRDQEVKKSKKQPAKKKSTK